MSGPWYVDSNGEVFTYRMHSPDTIKLSDGRVVNPEKEDCALFAVDFSNGLWCELDLIRLGTEKCGEAWLPVNTPMGSGWLTWENSD